MKKLELFPRKCDITGEGMWEGYCVNEGDMYIKYEKDFLRHIGSETDYDSIEDAYEDDYYYYTEWDELDDDVNYTASGEEILTINK